MGTATGIRAGAAYLEHLFGLSGRVAVVTGGSSGIGREMATALGMAGSTVIIVARRAQPVQDTVSQLRAAGATAFGLNMDVGRDVDAIGDAVIRDHGVPDILVNAAGVNPRPHMDNLTMSQWDEVMAVNLTAPFALGQRFGPAMAERGSGRIINIVSQQAFRAFGNSGAYGASKGGLVSLTRSQAEAWSPRGVLCNAVAPGFVDTPMTAAVIADQEKSARHVARAMIGRNGLPEDFAGIAVYLASEASKAVTGQCFFVDGGYSAT
ncbi:Gluconate 5-dehydrogenase-like protein [Hapsidospora chrysogenum ATCC 11550]|uniref:Gluconate 5-dehydrogenase-like protein n=1 Tax=Hapsidospora chrysogenum (strain ATCC 11550 / CBS 779.69 / DSM 880 / IAM 14645 / JCM 23072 / IMI 49137) TaxID=857340 RepID=A0A086SW85_HAPC1|nr:Gluconate 5-dehydrogenase-like protein [Hapsidospora chrysogenum ATCC 11550]